MTLTLDIPDDLVEYLQSVPADERNNYAVALMRRGVETPEDEDDEEIDPADYPISERDITAIREGLAEVEAGLSVDGNAVIAKAFARFGVAYPPSVGK